MPMDAIIGVMIKIVIMTAFGLILKKTRVLDDAGQKTLSDLLVQGTLPVSLIVAGNAELLPSRMGNLLFMGIFSVAYYGLSLGLLWRATKRLRVSPGTRGMIVNLSTFPNVGFIGLPVLMEMFGSESVLYGVVFNLLFNPLLFTVGIRFFGATEKTSLRATLLKPVNIASVFTIALFLSPFRLPDALLGALKPIGDMTAPLSLIIIGCGVASLRPRKAFANRWAYAVIALRMFLIPMIVVAACMLAGMKGLAPITAAVLCALPPGTTTVMLAEKYGGDVDLGVSCMLMGLVFLFPALLLTMYAANFAFSL